MGNVLASQLPSPPMETAIENSDTELLGNPGTMEDLHKRCREVFPSVFEGAKLLLNMSVSSHLQVSHTIHMSAVDESVYRFGAMYAGTEQTQQGDHCPVLVGEMDPSGNLTANGVYRISSRLKSKFCVQVVDGKFPVVQMSADYIGDDSSIALVLANPSIMGGSGLGVCHYLKQVTPRIALGAELAYQVGNGVPGGQAGTITVGARWTGDTSIWSTTIGSGGGHLCFYQRASDQLSLGVELENSNRAHGSVATLGYIIDLPRADITVRGMLDSNGLVGATLQRTLEPLPVNFALSASLNQATGDFSLGCGLVIS